jgi:antitoxin component of RelBE/YafQ-DinJ toxin-antitoxin module
MKENIHLKISASDKKELAAKAEEIGLSLSAYIRLKLKESAVAKELILREIVS